MIISSFNPEKPNIQLTTLKFIHFPANKMRNYPVILRIMGFQNAPDLGWCPPHHPWRPLMILMAFSRTYRVRQITQKTHIFQFNIPVLLRSQLPSHTKNPQLLRGEIPNSGVGFPRSTHRDGSRSVLSIKRSGLKVSSGK